jgi:hypothetical protein
MSGNAVASDAYYMTPTIYHAPVRYIPQQFIDPDIRNESTLLRVREALARSLRISSMGYVAEKSTLKDLGKDTWRYRHYIDEDSRFARTIQQNAARVVLKMLSAILSLGRIDSTVVRFEYCITLADFNHGRDSVNWLVQMNKYGHTTAIESNDDEVMLE